MGNRANYVLIEGGRPEIYFSRWGAPSIPAVLLSGPETTIAYVRALIPDDDLQDCVWAEGGVVLNLDRRELLFFGGGRIETTPYLRRPLLLALRACWPGWSVEWARFGIADLALSLGWEVGKVLDTEFDDPKLLHSSDPLIHERAVRVAYELKHTKSIFSVQWSDGDVLDYWLAPLTDAALSLGPRLLELLKGLLTTALPREWDANIPGSGAFVDATTQAIWTWDRGELDPRKLAAIARRWPGWHVDGHVEGLVRQVLLSGRDPAAVTLPEERAISELVEELTHDSTTDPASLYAAFTRSEQSPLLNQGEITFGKGFFSADTPPLSADERREILLRHLRSISTGADSSADSKHD